jgi:phospholipid/cholesterol/gamma-HCH transport system substrate-binding protein
VKRANLELVVGGSIILAFFILVAGTLWLKEVNVTRKSVRYTVLFPNVGALQVGDAVMTNGVKMGAVLKISLDNRYVKVLIELDKDVVLTDSAVITVQNVGLLGERAVGILLSEKGAVCKPNGKNKGELTYLHGNFDTGIAEAMGMLGSVLSEVQELVVNVSSIVDQTVADTSFIRSFHTILARVDSISGDIDDLVSRNKAGLNNTLASVNRISTSVDGLLQEKQETIESIIDDGKEMTARFVSISQRVDSLAAFAGNIARDIDQGKGSIGMMLKDEQFFLNVKNAVADIDTLVNDVREDALKLRVRFGFGKNK